MKKLISLVLALTLGLGFQLQAQVTVSGNASYAKATADFLPLKNITVVLKQGSTIVYQTTTNNAGYYEFTNVQPGNYTLTAISNLQWGYAAATDELAILQYFVGSRTLTPIQKKVADVNNDQVINCRDALMIARRFVSQITQFPSGDWYLESFDLTVGSSAITQNILGACFGDVNLSGNPQ